MHIKFNTLVEEILNEGITKDDVKHMALQIASLDNGELIKNDEFLKTNKLQIKEFPDITKIRNYITSEYAKTNIETKMTNAENRIITLITRIVKSHKNINTRLSKIHTDIQQDFDNKIKLAIFSVLFNKDIFKTKTTYTETEKLLYTNFNDILSFKEVKENHEKALAILYLIKASGERAIAIGKALAANQHEGAAIKINFSKQPELRWNNDNKERLFI